ncbi:MAG: glucose 1-dehydrogenase [Hyphomonadaceae bacterium]|nr:glucose 1-dehydrogenase [Hyphomonadaceae bacterium]
MEGKVAIVTGAARGLGQAFAARLASAGAYVIAGDVRDCAETAALAPEKIRPVTLDVTSDASIAAAVEAALSEFGRVDALINNAALYGALKGGRFEKIDEAEWQRAFDVNVTGIWRCCKAVTPHMRTQGGGAIVNISSIGALHGNPLGLHYTATKGAVITMTRSLARELGADNIRVNAIAPSGVATDGTAEFFGDKTEKMLGKLALQQSIPRNPEPRDMAAAALWLVSDESRFVTGQTIVVDGGMVML